MWEINISMPKAKFERAKGGGGEVTGIGHFFPGTDRPQFYLTTTNVTESIRLSAGVEMVMPSDNVNMEVGLISPVCLLK